jgi:hypothetical protein
LSSAPRVSWPWSASATERVPDGLERLMRPSVPAGPAGALRCRS